jgi:CBS-domain-containing membrane protein
MKLEFTEIDEIDYLMWPDNYQEISRDSPALSVFTDFKVRRPLILEPDTAAHEAEDFMLSAHVKLKLVVSEGNHFLGVVAMKDLRHPDFLTRIAAVYNRENLKVVDIMRPRATLDALAYADLEKATVGDIINSLQHYAHQHCLVVDKASHRLRGILSVSDIARKLKIKIELQHTPSFAELHLAAQDQ